MNRLTPFRGTLFRLALTNASLVGIVAAVFLYVEQARAGRAEVRDVTARMMPVAPDATSLLSEPDRRLVIQAAEITWREIQLAEMGMQKAATAPVREFAAMLVADQITARNEIETLAAQHGMALPTGTRPRPDAEQIAAAVGREFDASFLHWTGELHQRLLPLFAEAAREADDPELRAYARRMIPKLEAIQNQVRELQRTLR